MEKRIRRNKGHGKIKKEIRKKKIKVRNGETWRRRRRKRNR